MGFGDMDQSCPEPPSCWKSSVFYLEVICCFVCLSTILTSSRKHIKKVSAVCHQVKFVHDAVPCIACSLSMLPPSTLTPLGNKHLDSRCFWLVAYRSFICPLCTYWGRMAQKLSSRVLSQVDLSSNLCSCASCVTLGK